MKYAKLIEGDLIYAPRKMHIYIEEEPYIIYNPPAELLEDEGWLPIIETKPPSDAPEGNHYEPTYTEQITDTGTVIYQEWVLVQDKITEESALVRYSNSITGENDLTLVEAAETLCLKLSEED